MATPRLRYPIMDEQKQTQFWSKAKKTDDCWLWTGTTSNGYGIFRVNGRTFTAHRLAYFMTNGEFDTALAVCHHCDTPACVRPDHLFVGTQADNIHDMFKKGRDNQRPHKLSMQQIVAIKQKYEYGKYGYLRLSKEYGVAQYTIQRVIAGLGYYSAGGTI